MVLSPWDHQAPAATEVLGNLFSSRPFPTWPLAFLFVVSGQGESFSQGGLVIWTRAGQR